MSWRRCLCLRRITRPTTANLTGATNDAGHREINLLYARLIQGEISAAEWKTEMQKVHDKDREKDHKRKRRYYAAKLAAAKVVPT